MGAPRPLDEWSCDELDARALADARRLQVLARSADRLAGDLEAHPELWAHDGCQLLPPHQRRTALALFDRVLDLEIAYDAIAGLHLEFWRIDPIEEAARHARHFAIGTAAYFARLAVGLEFVERTLGKDPFERVLDEECREMGLAAGAYDRLKWNVVHVEHVAGVFAARQYHKVMRLTSYRDLAEVDAFAFTIDEVDRRYARIKDRLKHEGPRLFAGNTLEILGRAGQRAFMPVQTEIAGWLGDTKVKRENAALITLPLIHDASAKLRPGDILFARRNWYLSNVGLPGFWPHAALWIGTPEDVKARLGTPLLERLRQRHPDAYAAWTRPYEEDGFAPRVLEAVSEGVIFTSAEHCLAADYAAAVRPRRGDAEIAAAIERAFGYFGRPYDFDFDFHTDGALVCSELVYKAWEPRPDADLRGVRFDVIEILGRPTLPPNTMVAQFDREHGTSAQQLDFVFFLDARESSERAFFADLDAFRASHRRPKWDLALE